jgi:fructose/tagatose bisphosphate aldolase
VSPRIVVHSLEQARAALAAAVELGVPLTLASAVGAGGNVGPLWFKALIDAAREDHPAVNLTAVLDCADEAGTALGALRAGFKCVRFTGPAEVHARIAAIAAELGATIDQETAPERLDLLDVPDPRGAVRAFLARK